MTPGVTKVIPDRMQLSFDDDDLIGNTEPFSLKYRQNDSYRSLLPSLIYVENEDGTEVLLDAKPLFDYAKTDDTILFEEEPATQTVKLTPHQKKQLHKYYPNLYNDFWALYQKRQDNIFFQLYADLISAVHEASTRGEGSALESKFSDQGRKKVSAFYHYWKHLPHNYKNAYAEIRCDNGKTLGHNLALVFMGTLTANDDDRHTINIQQDLHLSKKEIASIKNIFSCMSQMENRLTKVTPTLQKIESNLKESVLPEISLANFNFLDKKSDVMDNPDVAKLNIYLMPFIYSNKEKNSDFREFITQCLFTLPQENFLTTLKKALLNKYKTIDAVFNITDSDSPSLRLITFIFRSEISTLSLNTIKQVILACWQQDPNAVFTFANKSLRRILPKNIISDYIALIQNCEPLANTKRKKILWDLLTNNPLGNNKELLALMAECSQPFALNTFLNESAKIYDKLKWENREIFINNLLTFLATHPSASINSMDLCILLDKRCANHQPQSYFDKELLENCAKKLASKNFAGMVFLLNYLSHKATNSKVEISKNLLKNNREYVSVSDTSEIIIGTIELLAIVLALVFSFIFCTILPPIGPAIGFLLLLTGFFFPISIAILIDQPWFIAHLKLKSTIADLFSFHPKKRNQADFWLSTDSRYQKNTDYGLVYALEPFSKVGKGALKIFKPFRSPLDALSYTIGIFLQPFKAIKNMGIGLTKSFLGAPLLLAAGLGQAIAGGNMSVAKEAFKRSSALFVRGLAQTALGVFQLLTALPALVAPPLRLVITLVKNGQRPFIKTKPEMESAVAACVRAINQLEQDNTSVKDEPVNNPAPSMQLLKQANAPANDNSAPSIQSKEVDAFNCVRRAIEKGVKRKAISATQFPHLLNLSFFNTRGEMTCSAEVKTEIASELTMLQSLAIR